MLCTCNTQPIQPMISTEISYLSIVHCIRSSDQVYWKLETWQRHWCALFDMQRIFWKQHTLLRCKGGSNTCWQKTTQYKEMLRANWTMRSKGFQFYRSLHPWHGSWPDYLIYPNLGWNSSEAKYFGLKQLWGQTHVVIQSYNQTNSPELVCEAPDRIFRT